MRESRGAILLVLATMGIIMALLEMGCHPPRYTYSDGRAIPMTCEECMTDYECEQLCPLGKED